MIELIKISKQYDSVTAVDALSMSVQEGRIFGFLGPNGAGKTTAIRMLMNIIMPDSGSILFDGSDMRPAVHRIGYLPEERGLYQKISVFETLQYFAHLRNVDDADRKIIGMLDRFDLGSRKQSKVNELSKGNQQKLQFINTILHDPEYIVLDEPFSGLDPVNQLLLKEILEEMKQAGKTIIFSSHQMDQVERLCDDVALINNGHLVTAGTLNEIMSNHANRLLQITPVIEKDLAHKYFLERKADIRSGSAFIQIGDQSKQELIAEINAIMDIRSIRVAEPGLEDIFIQLITGAEA